MVSRKLLELETWISVVAIGAALWGYMEVGTAFLVRLQQFASEMPRWNANIAASWAGNTPFSFALALAQVAIFAGGLAMIRSRWTDASSLTAALFAVILSVSPLFRLVVRASAIGLGPHAVAYSALLLAGYATAAILVNKALWNRSNAPPDRPQTT